MSTHRPPAAPARNSDYSRTPAWTANRRPGRIAEVSPGDVRFAVPNAASASSSAGIRLEHLVEARDLEQPGQRPLHADELHVAAAFDDLLVQPDEGRDADARHVAEARAVDDELPGAAVDDPLQVVGKRRRHVRVESPIGREDQHVRVGLVVVELHRRRTPRHASQGGRRVPDGG